MTYFAKCNVNLYLEHFQVFLIFYSSSTHKLVCTEKRSSTRVSYIFILKVFFLALALSLDLSLALFSLGTLSFLLFPFLAPSTSPNARS